MSACATRPAPLGLLGRALPLCTAQMFEHLDICGSVHGPDSAADCLETSDSSASTQPTQPIELPNSNTMLTMASCVHCPTCRLEFTLSELNCHLDTGCEPPDVRIGAGGGLTPPSEATDNKVAGEPSTSVSGPSEGDTVRLERMAEELTCRICFDLFTEPQSLPCQHSFCRECIHGCFKVTSRMQCPLCKAPVWLRQLSHNHTLAGIVQVFTQMQDAGQRT